ncbi:MAG TPA: hypothetical protein VNP04_11100 [Alphaproteobacteria bacterium]|nr:hypothetical protein [Alphaproteobacteria bacterium]
MKTVGMLRTLVMLATLTGCTVGPHYVRPATDVAATWGRGTQPGVQVGEPIDVRCGSPLATRNSVDS